MNISPEPIDRYYVGGSLQVDNRTYVTRRADRDFYEGLKAGEFCYVLNSRQMGKSSLGVRTMARLEFEDIACAYIDITSIVDVNITEDKWYAGLIRKLLKSFEIDSNINLKNWLSERNFLSSVQRFSEFIETVVLAKPNQKFVIFIDEIDSILQLGSPADDFFAYIRSCWNDRATKPEYNRLTFAILGVATPSDLMQDRRRTPFNIGRAIELNGFSFYEAQPLVIGLAPKAENPQAVLQEILVWTGGQPFLTQKVCQLIAQSDVLIRAESETELVSSVIRTNIIEDWQIHDRPEHLETIRNRIFKSIEKQTARLLGIYQQILINGEIDPDNSREQIELRLTGLVVKFDNKLKVYNRIYREVFNRDWLDQALIELRPYAESLNAWVASEYQDESRLLRGLALHDALKWSVDRNLNSEDYRFLSASQAAALEIETQENVTLAAAKKVAEFSLTQAQRQMRELLEEEDRAKQRLIKTEQSIKVGSIVFAIMAAAIVAGGFWLKRSMDNVKLAGIRLASIESKAALSDHQGLEAMVQAVRAGKKLRELDNKSVETKNEEIQALQVLQESNYRVLEQNRLQGHTSYVMSASFSPDSSKIVTASADKTAWIWAVQGNFLFKLIGHTSYVTSASFSPDGSKIVTASADKTARVWDLQGKLLSTITGHTSSVRSANFSPDGRKIVTASADKTARVWDLQGKLLSTLIGHTSDVRSANFSPDGSKIVTASGDRATRIWDNQGKLLKTLTGHTSYVTNANFSPDGSKIVTASGDKTARIWDTKGTLLSTLTDHTSDVRSANFSPDGSKIITASDDKTARIWNVKDTLFTTLTILRGHTKSVWSARFNPDGNKIVTASDDNTARIWDVQGSLLTTLRGHTKSVWSAMFNPDGNKIVTASDDNTALIWDVQGKLLATLKGYTGEISHDGSKIVTAANDNRAIIWDVKGKELKELDKRHTRIIRSARFNPDGNKIVTASDDSTARIWDVQGSLLATLRGHTKSVWSARFSPDGSKIVTASDDNTARIWDVQGNLLATLIHSGSVISAVFSPNGSKIVTASDDNTAGIWDVQGNLLATLTGHTSSIRSATFSFDGSKIVTASDDKTARIWDVQGNLLATLTGHTKSVWSAMFSPDGSKILTASQDNTARMWDRIDSLDTNLDRLLTRSCKRLHDYLATNPTVKPEDRELCGIKKVE
jgi:WD40 repeat protein